MKRTSILLIIISLAFTSITAQNADDIKKIKKWYYTTKEQIKFSKHNKVESKLYCDIIENNVYNKYWRVVGKFHVKSQFWYNEQLPDQLDNPRTGLNMVIIDGTHGPITTYTEYLFHDGQLVFVFYKTNGGEIRYYFKDNKLIKQLGKFEEEIIPTAKESQSNAETYMNKYLKGV